MPHNKSFKFESDSSFKQFLSTSRIRVFKNNFIYLPNHEWLMYFGKMSLKSALSICERLSGKNGELFQGWAWTFGYNFLECSCSLIFIQWLRIAFTKAKFRQTLFCNLKDIFIGFNWSGRSHLLVKNFTKFFNPKINYAFSNVVSENKKTSKCKVGWVVIFYWESLLLNCKLWLFIVIILNISQTESACSVICTSLILRF